MSEQREHTPGPWKTGALMTQVEVWPDGWNVPLCIADCAATHSPPTEAERVANARLIAASPTLLGALRFLLSEYNQHVPEDCICPKVIQAADAARAAIAKATE